MRRPVTRLAAILIALGTSPASLWAHPSTGFHVHADEIAGLLVVSLVVVGILALAGKKER